MKKIFLILCLGIIGFSRISLAAKEKGEEIANNTHFNIGKKVREVMIEISGTKPEELPTPKKSIKEIQKEKKLLKKPNKKR